MPTGSSKARLPFAQLIKTNLMQRCAIADLLKPSPPPAADQPRFDFGPAATRAAQRRRHIRAGLTIARAA
jgi:hypothetical protein